MYAKPDVYTVYDFLSTDEQKQKNYKIKQIINITHDTIVQDF